MLVGVIVALQLADLRFHTGLLSLGVNRLRPLNTNAERFAFAGNAIWFSIAAAVSVGRTQRQAGDRCEPCTVGRLQLRDAVPAFIGLVKPLVALILMPRAG